MVRWSSELALYVSIRSVVILVQVFCFSVKLNLVKSHTAQNGSQNKLIRKEKTRNISHFFCFFVFFVFFFCFFFQTYFSRIRYIHLPAQLNINTSFDDYTCISSVVLCVTSCVIKVKNVDHFGEFPDFTSFWPPFALTSFNETLELFG